MPRHRTALAAIFSVLLGASAHASTPYDGIWIVDFPASPLVAGESHSVCPALRLRADVADGKISGSLTRFFPDNVVENDTGPASSPVTGTVHPDGSVEAYWLGWIVKGQITGDTANLTLLFGECGPRYMIGRRVAPDKLQGAQ